MTTRDLKSNVDVALSLVPAARTNGTAGGTAVDLTGYDSAMIEVMYGAWTDGTHTPSLLESDDNTTYTAVAAADLQGTFTALSGTAGQNAIQRVGYAGDARYLKAQILTAGATTGALSAANIVRGHPARAPLA